jgi:hypothetical protein
MNFDYLEFVKRQCKDTFCFDRLKYKYSSASGIHTYTLTEAEDITLKYNEFFNEMTVKANFSYFFNGHNFQSSIQDIINGLYYVSEAVASDMLTAHIKSFEYGTTLEIQHNCQEYISNHISYNKNILQPFYKKNRLTGKVYDCKLLRFKIYDAGFRISTNITKGIKTHLEQLYSYDRKKQYIRLENVIKQPEIYFMKRNITMQNLISLEFRKQCKESLLEEYSKIKKASMVKIPEKKKDLNMAMIYLIQLQEIAYSNGIDIEKQVSKLIKQIPDSTLNTFDKKARKRQFKKHLNSIKQLSTRYDLTEQLQAKGID